MNKNGPIIVIEDDKDDQELMLEAFQELGYKNEIRFFGDGELALDHLVNNDVEPFIVFSDINMPKLNGMELREKIHNNEDLRLKSIPYLFFSTTAEQQFIIDAYSKSVQGFFVKPTKYSDLRDTLKTIIEYWKTCVSPNYVK
ncbi:response regulator [Flavobacterium sp.]|uniref:response regulator n=1 Tax=Flavobacterium sp. TaxID=239 RepID=UPI0025EE4DBA|nr:response regulator [Flavobacterium sp.]